MWRHSTATQPISMLEAERKSAAWVIGRSVRAEGGLNKLTGYRVLTGLTST